MRISWGYKLFIAYSLFAAGILFLAYKASKQRYDLVADNYYEQELKYQDVIDQKNRAARLSAPPKISHTINSVSIQLPGEFTGKEVNGDIYLYRPSDASKDIRKTFTTAVGFYQLNFDKDISGSYELKLSWEAGGQQYFEEKRIFF